MIARSVSMRLKPNTVAEFTKLIEHEILSLLRKQKGFKDEVTLVASHGADAVGITFWDEKQNMESYSRDAYPELLKILARVLDGTPEIHTYEVTNSTFHKIAAHAAA